jgi:hypothetical protein
MFKNIFSKTVVCLIIFIVIVLAIVLFVFGNFFKREIGNSVSPTPTFTSSQNVPLPTKEDTIRAFCNLVDEGKISGAVSMMNITDDTTRQSWGVSLNNFSSFKLTDIKKSAIDEKGNSFEVDIDVKLKKDLTDLPIPNYGWENGINKRWFNLIDNGRGNYKIEEIATGP